MIKASEEPIKNYLIKDKRKKFKKEMLKWQIIKAQFTNSTKLKLYFKVSGKHVGINKIL